MLKTKITAFDTLLLIVGVAAAYLGFQLINQVYLLEKTLSWLMVISIFLWLMLLILFILLSVAADVSKKQLAEMMTIAELLSKKKGKK
jgi:hypothetical protein|tara:strand:+ start:1302 stop:1565 length:264 start_codon:yes stop_codon:yes gene_type:complete